MISNLINCSVSKLFYLCRLNIKKRNLIIIFNIIQNVYLFQDQHVGLQQWHSGICLSSELQRGATQHPKAGGFKEASTSSSSGFLSLSNTTHA